MYRRVENKYGVLGGRKIPVVLDEVDVVDGGCVVVG
jgi:hypothetical protein